MKLKCLYDCPLCGLVRAEVDVPAREEESVLDWMDKTTLIVCADHHRRSPACEPTSLKNLMIPMMNKKGVGYSTEQ